MPSPFGCLMPQQTHFPYWLWGIPELLVLWIISSFSAVGHKFKDDNKPEKRPLNITTELRAPPVGWLSSCMGTLSRKLSQRAADTQVFCTVGAGTHVLHTGLDVRLSVNQFSAGTPGLGTQHLFTVGLLKGKMTQLKILHIITYHFLKTRQIMNSQIACMTPAYSKPPLPLHMGPHNHHLVDGLCVCCQTQLGLFCDLHIIIFTLSHGADTEERKKIMNTKSE